MDKRLWAVAVMAVVSLGAACMHATPAVADERLYFALEVRDGDQVLARPQVLGETGKHVSLSLNEPKRVDLKRLSLDLWPQFEGDHYKVDLDLALRNADPVHGELALSHGEERTVRLEGDHALTVKVLLMRVDSPEFDAYMQLARRRLGQRTS